MITVFVPLQTSNIIQIVTGVEVITENFQPKVRKMLPLIDDRGQRSMNWGETFSVMIDTPVTICLAIPQKSKANFLQVNK